MLGYSFSVACFLKFKFKQCFLKFKFKQWVECGSSSRYIAFVFILFAKYG